MFFLCTFSLSLSLSSWDCLNFKCVAEVFYDCELLHRVTLKTLQERSLDAHFLCLFTPATRLEAIAIRLGWRPSLVPLLSICSAFAPHPVPALP